jgi:nicotinamidase-related amidase
MTEKTALLVIDVQTAMFAEPQRPYEADRMLANTRALIDRARDAGVDVIFVRHCHARYEPMKQGNPGWHVHPLVAPAPGETIIDKRACDAFHDTPLHAELTARGVQRLVIAGMQTELCVDTACRSALHRDYNVVLASDAHSTWDTDHLTAARIIAHHNATLANVPHPTKEIAVVPAVEIAFSEQAAPVC